MYELMGWEGTGNLLYVTCHCRMSKAGGTVLILMERMLLIKIFSRIRVDTKKCCFQPSCGEEGFNIAMTMIESGEIDLVIIDSDIP
jgi:RecA/RadA recombinase